MIPAKKLELEQVMAANKKWPLVVVNAKISDFTDATILSASIAQSDLYKSFESKSLLIIDGLDTASQQEQEKFLSLLKDRRMGLSKLPENVQVIIPVTSKEGLAKKIQSLCLFWEV